MDNLEFLYSRRSMRRYTDQPVSPKQLQAILKAAMLAPSSRNGQPWHFVVIRDAAMREALMEYQPNMSFARYADMVILVCADTTITTRPQAYSDCAAATMNILLAAHAQGLGACWCAIHPYEDRQTAIAELCHIPEHICVFSAVTVGHPGKENPPVPDRFRDDRIHNETW